MACSCTVFVNVNIEVSSRTSYWLIPRCEWHNHQWASRLLSELTQSSRCQWKHMWHLTMFPEPLRPCLHVVMQHSWSVESALIGLSSARDVSSPKVLLLCRSWGACVPRRSQGLCQLEFWLLVGTTMLDRLWARGQTKCNTPLKLATSVFGRIHRRPCYVMAQPKSTLDIPWPNDAECMGHVWYHFSCWYPLLL